MPTGYTAALYEGKEDVSLGDFIMRCAHAFVIDARDMSMDSELPEPQVRDYFYKSVAKDEATLRMYEARTDEDWAFAEADHRAQRLQQTKDGIKDSTAKRARYETMLMQVKGWQPPTEKHQGLKDFMVSQIEESIKFDCGTFGLETAPKVTAKEFRDTTLARARKDLQRSRERLAEEIERQAANYAWITALRNSVAAVSA